jgi:hypothetical protein
LEKTLKERVEADGFLGLLHLPWLVLPAERVKEPRDGLGREGGIRSDWGQIPLHPPIEEGKKA